MNLKEEFKKIDEHFANISPEELLADLIASGLKIDDDPCKICSACDCPDNTNFKRSSI